MRNRVRRPIRVGFQGLELSCIIGVRETERLSEQQIVVDIDMLYDAADAIAGDTLDHAVDYSAAARSVEACLRRARFGLLESACAAIADGLLAELPRVDEIDVTVRKPGALEGSGFAYARLRRSRY